MGKQKMLSCLSNDILVEIFVRQPIDSLVRMKSVQKSWNAIISDPIFISKHLEFTKSKSHGSIVVGREIEVVYSSDRERYQYDYDLRLLTSFIDNNNKSICVNGVTEKLRFPFLEDYYTSDSYRDDSIDKVVSLVERGYCRLYNWESAMHCDGLVCLTSHCIDDGYSVVALMVCNPVLHELMLLPMPESGYYERTWTRRFGFGFDPISGDYKVIWICYYDTEFEAEVYTLGGDSWRQVNAPPGISFDKVFKRGLYLKGGFYWVKKLVEYHKLSIIRFDMHSEKFHILPGPSKAAPTSIYQRCDLWNEKLTLLFRCLDQSYEMWFMDNKYDIVKGGKGNCTWTKHVVVGPLIGNYKPIGFWGDELLLEDWLKHQVFMYNLGTRTQERINFSNLICTETSSIYVRTSYILHFFFCDYVKSLVSVFGRVSVDDEQDSEQPWKRIKSNL